MFAKIFPPREITFIRQQGLHFPCVLLSKDTCNYQAGFLIIHLFIQQTFTEPLPCARHWGDGGDCSRQGRCPPVLTADHQKIINT